MCVCVCVCHTQGSRIVPTGGGGGSTYTICITHLGNVTLWDTALQVSTTAEYLPAVFILPVYSVVQEEQEPQPIAALIRRATDMLKKDKEEDSTPQDEGQDRVLAELG